MPIDPTRKSAAATLCSGVLAGFLFAGCSGQSTTGNKLDDPELKRNMKDITDQFKAKTQQMKTNRKGSSKGFNHP